MAYTVTPWEVKGDVEYDKLIKEFGTFPLTDKLLARLEKHAGGLHPYLRRKLFFSHRDFDWILNRYEKGEKFVLYTGRGPSGNTHIGHLVPWIFTRWLQEKFGAKLYFQLTDDEKFWLNQGMDLNDTTSFGYENALDIIAVGFDPKLTKIFNDTEYAKTLYPIAAKVAKRTTLSTAKAIFGFKDSSNIGITFFPAMQAAPCFLPTILEGKNTPVLIPAAIDQDPYWRVSRDAAPKLGWYKPAQIHSKFLPGLGGGKMSASDPASCVYTTDAPEVAEKKVMSALTGGRDTIAEQRQLGGKPDKCVVYDWHFYLFEHDDRAVEERFRKCKKGELMCGDCKKDLAGYVKAFLEGHQKRREKAKKNIDRFISRD